MKNTSQDNQSGFVLMFLLVIMVIGVGAYFSKFAENNLFQIQPERELEALYKLEKVKQKLLLYAVQHPEIYSTSASASYHYYEAFRVPGPGYFPCPDNDGRNSLDIPNGKIASSCLDTTSFGEGFVHGFLAPSIKSRNVFFTSSAQTKKYYFVVLEELVHQNPRYVNTILGTNLNRFAPLNYNFSPASLLSLNGRSDFVALIFLPGVPQDFSVGFRQNQNLNGVEHFLDYKISIISGSKARKAGNVLLDNSLNNEFFTRSTQNLGINDLVVGITLEEWRGAMLQRVLNQKNLFCNELSATVPHWFNEYHPAANPVGSSWRGLLCL